MVYGLIPYIFIPIFLTWVLYRAVIKKDIKKYKNETIAGGVFVGLWTLIFIISSSM